MRADTTISIVLFEQQSPGLAAAESRPRASALHVSAAEPQRQSVLPQAFAASVPHEAKVSQQRSAPSCAATHLGVGALGEPCSCKGWIGT